MRVLSRSKAFEETSAENVARLFPYLGDRLDAIAEIRHDMYDVAAINSLGRRLARQGALGRRLASLPQHVIEEMALYYDNKLWFTDPKLVRQFLAANPEWGFTKDR